jgi:hypothetical protein
MKKIAIIIISLSICSCTCQTIEDQHSNLKSQIETKNNEIKQISNNLEENQLNDENIQERLLIEDEMLMLMIDVALLEIELENFEKDNSDCL